MTEYSLKLLIFYIYKLFIMIGFMSLTYLLCSSLKQLIKRSHKVLIKSPRGKVEEVNISDELSTQEKDKLIKLAIETYNSNHPHKPGQSGTIGAGTAETIEVRENKGSHLD